MATPTKTRTALELQNPDLNYYIAFKIEPKVTDVAKIDEAIKKKRNTFAKDQSVINSRLVELKEDIDQVMLNDAIYVVDATGVGCYTPNSGGRKKEAEAAKLFSLKEATDSAKALCERGYIWDKEITQIAGKMGVASQDIQDSISSLFKQGIELKKTVDTKREVPFKTFDNIEQCLRTLNKKNLYQFLTLSETSTLEQLLNKNQEVYSDAQKQGKSSTQKATVDLTGYIKVVFKSAGAKKEYDTYYRGKDQVWDKLSMFKDSGIKSINDALFVKFVDALIQKAGLTLSEAEKELDAYLSFFGIVKEAKTGDAAIKIAQCPYDDCGKSYIVKDGMKICPNCGRSLEIKCWNCGHVMFITSATKGCDKCGVSRKQQSEFDAAYTNFDRLFNNTTSSETDLIKALNGMENIFPNYTNFQSSFISSKIAESQKAIEKKKKEKEVNDALYEKYVKEINVLMAKKQVCKAAELLKELKINAPTYDTRVFEEKINEALKQAQQLVDTANNYLKSNNEAAAIGSCSKALLVCSDFSVAIQILKNYPPKSPKQLTFKIVRNTVKLDWLVEGNQSAVSYSVIRKIGSAPSNDEDGEILEDGLSINFFEDSSAISATAYYYGVFAERGGIRSSVVTTTNPAVLFLDITNLRQEKTNDSIKATWNKPDNVYAVEVYRKLGATPPSGITDGEKIAVDSNNTSFIDKNLQEDKNSYFIICKYYYSGKEYYSAGIKASYRRFRIPKSLSNIKLSSVGAATDFSFTCDEPENGTIKLYLSKKKMDYLYEVADDKANFIKKCKELREIDATVISNNKLHFSIPENTIEWLYPVISNEQLYMLHEPFLLNSVVGIDNLNVIYKSGQVTIEGSVHSNVRNIIAIIKQDEFAETIDDQGERRICSYETFVKDGGFFIALKPGRYYISLFAEFLEGGERVYSRATKLPEVVDNRQKTVVQYALNYSISVSRSFIVKIDFYSDEEVELSPIAIMAGYPKPLKKNNGIKIGQIDGGKLKKKFLKKGYFYSVSANVDRANNIKDKLVLFFDSDKENRLFLKEVQGI